MNRNAITAKIARQLSLGAQGLLDDPTRRASVQAVRRLIEHMGFVQIDTINVVERAHHLILAARLDGYRPRMLATLLEDARDLFEHWTHDASAIPTRWFAHWKPRFERYRGRDPEHGWWKVRLGDDPLRMIAEVKDRIQSEGPLMSSDFERGGEDRSGVKDAWWQWKPQKAALEHLWRVGEIMVARRVNFQKVYDLTHRVLPDHCNSDVPDAAEHVDWACRTALDRLGTATPREIAAFWNAVSLAQARQWCQAQLKAGSIVDVVVEAQNGETPTRALAMHDWRQRIEALGDPPQRIRLLCPFDPLLRDRKRTARLFGFDYAFEGFVPPAKRKYGYYVMPMLEGDRLIGRVNPKFHRDRGELEIRGVWWEPKVRVTKRRQVALDESIERLAAFIGAQSYRVGR